MDPSDLGNRPSALSADRYAQAHAEIRPEAGLLDVALLSSLIEVLQLGTRYGVAQFFTRFRLTSFIIRSGPLPSSNEPLLELEYDNRLLLTLHPRVARRGRRQTSPIQKFARGGKMRSYRRGLLLGR